MAVKNQKDGFQMRVEDPPPKSGRGSLIGPMIEFIRGNTGRWCLVAECERYSTDASYAQRLRKHSPNDVETAVRKSDLRSKVYARWVGSPAPQKKKS